MMVFKEYYKRNTFKCLRHIKYPIFGVFPIHRSTYSQKPHNAVKNERGRYNALGIKMLSKSLHRQLFGREVDKEFQSNLEKTIKSLLSHGLLKDTSEKKSDPDIEFVMPKLRGRTLEEHFFQIGSEFAYPYKKLADDFVTKDAEVYPGKFVFQSGWTKYPIENNQLPQKVPYPDDPILVFDVETAVTANNIPVMATAFSGENWYSWVSPYLMACRSPRTSNNQTLPGELPMKAFIPFGIRSQRPQLIIGHNVSFDRSYIKEEYYPQPGQRFFLDTLSLHQCVGGFATSQRKRAKTTRFLFKDLEDIYFEQVNLQKITNKSKEMNADWLECGSFDDLNSLAMFYLSQPTEKSTRDVFVGGSLTLIRDNFQKLMSYCAHDVLVTFAIFKRLWPLYLEHSPSPVSLAGILMLSKCYLPINNNWKSYVNSSDVVFDRYADELSNTLKSCAIDTIKEGLQSSSIKDKNLWVKHLDWSIDLPRVKNFYVSKEYGSPEKEPKKTDKNSTQQNDPWSKCKIPDLIGTASVKKTPVWAIPKWYKKLVGSFDAVERTGLLPDKIETKDRIVPSILKMSWNGWPIVYNRLLGWGYLLNKNALISNQINIMGEVMSNENANKWTPNYHIFDFKKFHALNLRTKNKFNVASYETTPNEIRGRFILEHFYNINAGRVNPKFLSENQKPLRFDDFLNMIAFNLPQYEGYVFVPVPHPSGLKKTCGNPLARDYALHVLSGKMLPLCGEMGIRFYQLFLGSSFWQNNHDRIKQQMVGVFGKTIPIDYRNIPEQDSIGAIVPRLIPCGTITRRAVERTWLTASNPQQGMIGSEMKAAIQAPKGFVFVGADVDSEELWLASLLGDAAVGGFHGSTPFSYMNIAGTAATKTDLHSVTARAIGISRDSAKVINYSRLYGAGHKLAISQMLLSDSEITVKDAIIKTCYLFNFTKGLKILKLNSKGISLLKVYEKKHPRAKPLKSIITKKALTEIMSHLNIPFSKINKYGTYLWKGGSESEIFNLIDQFTYVDFARTPFLGAQMSNGLATFFTKNKFQPCKFNWTIQSSAVDFLHTFLVAAYWLFSILRIPARTIICVHDEMRLMVPEERAVEAAFALHIGNLLTRALFCQKVGINDLPQKNAFFESVEVDTIIRKKPNDKCITPSNPDGMVINTACVTGKSYTIQDCLNILGTEVFLRKNLK